MDKKPVHMISSMLPYVVNVRRYTYKTRREYEEINVLAPSVITIYITSTWAEQTKLIKHYHIIAWRLQQNDGSAKYLFNFFLSPSQMRISCLTQTCSTPGRLLREDSAGITSSTSWWWSLKISYLMNCMRELQRLGEQLLLRLCSAHDCSHSDAKILGLQPGHPQALCKSGRKTVWVCTECDVFICLNEHHDENCWKLYHCTR
jgi:hypothetical protein